MTEEELADLGAGPSLGQLVQARGMSWFHLPIADDEAPDAAFEQAWPGVQPRLLALLREGRHLPFTATAEAGVPGWRPPCC